MQVTGLTGLAVALIYLFQEKIDISITTRDGVRLHAWLLGLAPWAQQHRRNRPVILFFQENAGDMSFRLPFLRTMMRRLDCPVLAVSMSDTALLQHTQSTASAQHHSQAHG
ncbi:peptidase_S9 domain-containing protein [Haematococcus lacustris]|uniref:Peptidase_S9 domain-containing protein n=1 Tax=Haematococcus lacustris TaxID=44745 RepID=A0A6A0A7T2_HAELA|nr:peptidase_S9 domain-containing protein [Haematococcus lacustris]